MFRDGPRLDLKTTGQQRPAIVVEHGWSDQGQTASTQRKEHQPIRSCWGRLRGSGWRRCFCIDGQEHAPPPSRVELSNSMCWMVVLPCTPLHPLGAAVILPLLFGGSHKYFHTRRRPSGILGPCLATPRNTGRLNVLRWLRALLSAALALPGPACLGRQLSPTTARISALSALRSA